MNEDLGRLPRMGGGLPSTFKRIEQQPPTGDAESRRPLPVATKVEVVMPEFASRA